jgi:hypothetical protein
MIAHCHIQRKAQTPAAAPTATIPAPWQVRRWFTQAARLYKTPQAQQLAVLHQLDIIMTETPSPERWLWAQDVARWMPQEVQP